MPTALHNGNGTGMTVPTVPEADPDLFRARETCREILTALETTVLLAARGARDLRDGLQWSESLEQFESKSMDAVRILARFPISTANARFGARIHRARAAVFAFREAVRREIIGAIDSKTEAADYEQAMTAVQTRAAVASDSLRSVEQALTQYLSLPPASEAEHLPLPNCRETGRQGRAGTISANRTT